MKRRLELIRIEWNDLVLYRLASWNDECYRNKVCKALELSSGWDMVELRHKVHSATQTLRENVECANEEYYTPGAGSSAHQRRNVSGPA